jgi:hypothetical protein
MASRTTVHSFFRAACAMPGAPVIFLAGNPRIRLSYWNNLSLVGLK